MSKLPATPRALKKLTQMSATEFVEFIEATIDQKEGYGPVVYNGIGIGYENQRYYDNLPKDTATRLKGLITLEFAAFLQIAKQLHLVYAKGGITSGLYALEQAIQQNAPTLYKLGDYIGSPRHKKFVTEPNTRDNQIIGSLLQKQHPDHGIVAPTAREMSAKIAMSHPAFGRIAFEDVDFMVFWYLQQMYFQDTAAYTRDWNFTRNTIHEAKMETLKEFGLFPAQMHAALKPLDINGKPFSLLARMEKYAETIKVHLAYGIDFREAAQAFCEAATIDAWRREDNPRVKNAPHSSLHPSAIEFEVIDQLRAEIDPLIKTYGAVWLQPNDLLPEYREAHFTAKDESVPELPPELKAELKIFADDILGRIEEFTSIHMAPEERARLSDMPKPDQRRFDPDTAIFNREARSLFFHDKNLYDKCHEWEQALLPFIVWAMEIILLPYNSPMMAVVHEDFERGHYAIKYAQKHGIKNLDEVMPHAGARAEKLVLAPERRAAKKRLMAIKRSRPGKVVIGPEEFQYIFDVVEHLRATIPNFCGAGPSKTSSAFRLLIRKVVSERNANEVFFPEDWACSPDLVHLRGHGRNIQAGFIERPVKGVTDFHLYTEQKVIKAAAKPTPDKKDYIHWVNRPEAMDRDAFEMVKEFRRCATEMVRAPELGLELARLWARDQLVRPESSGIVQDDFLRPAYADLGVTAYDRKNMDDLLGAKSISPKGDAETDGSETDYFHLWNAQSAADAGERILSKPSHEQLPENAGELLRKFAHLWIVPKDRLVAHAADDDTADRKIALKVQNQLMQTFADAQESALSVQTWLKAHRPNHELLQVFDGPQQ